MDSKGGYLNRQRDEAQAIARTDRYRAINVPFYADRGVHALMKQHPSAGVSTTARLLGSSRASVPHMDAEARLPPPLVCRASFKTLR